MQIKFIKSPIIQITCCSPELCGLLGEVLAGTESPGTTPAEEGAPEMLPCG